MSVAVRAFTGAGAMGGVTTASRGTMLLGNSVVAAAQKLQADLKGHCLADLAGRSYFARFAVDWTTEHNVDGEIMSHFAYGFATHLVLLDDDGRLEKVVAAHDGGKIINPVLFEGQVEGGVVMGLGYALSERLPLKDGRLTSTRLGKLGLLKAGDVPEIEVIGVEYPDPIGPFGAKGVGEIACIPTAAAVANAFCRYDGRRRYSLPLSQVKKPV